ncbi:hypothetical protein [Burkholderia pyrrocinia]|nr:hypothetical protein [Burkholderia pyrrocinia]
MKDKKPMPLWKICVLCILIALACSIRFGDDDEYSITPPVAEHSA